MITPTVGNSGGECGAPLPAPKDFPPVVTGALRTPVRDPARAYFEAGDLEKAAAESEKILGLTTGRLYFGDIHAKSFYRLGKIAEKQGDKTKAAENYRRFLDLWKDADPRFSRPPKSF